jgi:flagellar motor switch protein FliN/FliY
MTDTDTIVEGLLAAALASAAEVVRPRVGRDLNVVDSELPQSSALLRFDVTFEGDQRLSWFVSNEDATGLSDLLIGGTGDRAAMLTEQHLDALSGLFSDMLERAVEGISAGLTSPLNAGGVDMGMEGGMPPAPEGGRQAVAAFAIDGFGLVTIVQQLDPTLAALVLSRLDLAAAPTPEGEAPAAAAAPGDTAAAAGGNYDNVVPLPNFTSQAEDAPRRDLSMLLNVPLDVTVELGRTGRTVRELLDLNVGSILELHKLAGDPMEIMVNGQALARGEVVVIDEEFGVRITEILSPEQRLRKLS